MWARWELAGLTGARVPAFRTRLDLLRFAASVANRDGLWVEFGVYDGETINVLAGLTDRSVVGFDSFEGLPARWTPRHPRGEFDLHGKDPQVAASVTLVKGWFSKTLPPFALQSAARDVALAHIDCDLYSSTKEIFRAFASAIHPGTVLVFDEYTGVVPDDEARAFREFLRSTGHRFQYLGCSMSGSVAVRIA